MKKNFLYMAFAIMLFLPNSASAYATSQYKDVKFNYGSFKMPLDAYIVEYDFKKALDKADEKTKKELGSLSELINTYQIMLFDGNSYYNASVMTVFFDNKVLNKPPFSIKDNGAKFELTPEQKQFILTNQDRLKDYLQLLVINGKNKMNYNKLYKIDFANTKEFWNNPSLLFAYEWPQIEQIKVGNNFGYKTDIRLAGLLFGIYGNVYMQAYAYNYDDKGVVAMFFFTVDSQREFWRDIFKNTLN